MKIRCTKARSLQQQQQKKNRNYLSKCLYHFLLYNGLCAKISCIAQGPMQRVECNECEECNRNRRIRIEQESEKEREHASVLCVRTGIDKVRERWCCSFVASHLFGAFVKTILYGHCWNSLLGKQENKYWHVISSFFYFLVTLGMGFKDTTFEEKQNQPKYTHTHISHLRWTNLISHLKAKIRLQQKKSFSFVHHWIQHIAHWRMRKKNSNDFFLCAGFCL